MIKPRVRLEKAMTTGWRVCYGCQVRYVGDRRNCKLAARDLCIEKGVLSYWHKKKGATEWSEVNI